MGDVSGLASASLGALSVLSTIGVGFKDREAL